MTLPQVVHLSGTSKEIGVLAMLASLGDAILKGKTDQANAIMETLYELEGARGTAKTILGRVTLLITSHPSKHAIIWHDRVRYITIEQYNQIGHRLQQCDACSLLSNGTTRIYHFNELGERASRQEVRNQWEIIEQFIGPEHG